VHKFAILLLTITSNFVFSQSLDTLTSIDELWIDTNSTSKLLLEMYQADQLSRNEIEIDWGLLAFQDERRRIIVLRILDLELLQTSKDHFYAAMIMQHGLESSNYKLAMQLANRAYELDSSDILSLWLASAAEDRFLHSIGEPQIWGTQFQTDYNGIWTYEPFDKTKKTDADRIARGIGSISEIEERVLDMNNGE